MFRSRGEREGRRVDRGRSGVLQTAAAALLAGLGFGAPGRAHAARDRVRAPAGPLRIPQRYAPVRPAFLPTTNEASQPDSQLYSHTNG